MNLNDPRAFEGVPAEDRASLLRVARVLSLQQGIDLAAVSTDLLQRACQARRQPSESLAHFVARLERDREAGEGLAQVLWIRARGVIGGQDRVAQLLERMRAWAELPQPFRLWVPACGDGREVALLALCAAESGLSGRCTVFGTDASAVSIEEARRGPDLALLASELPPALKARLVADADGIGLRLPPELLRCCTFLRQSLLDVPSFSGIDLVCARGILSTLVPATRRRLLERLHAVLAPKGLLWVTEAETSLVRGDLFADFPGGGTLPVLQALERRRAVAGGGTAGVSSGPGPIHGAFELARDPMAVLTPDGLITAVNPAWQQQVAGAADQQIGCHLFSLTVPTGSATDEPPRLPEAGETLSYTMSMDLLHGRAPVRVRLQHQSDLSILTVMTVDDGTVQVQLDQLRAQAHHVASLLREAVVVTDLRGSITQFPGSASRLASWTEADALGQPLERVLRIEEPDGQMLDWRAEGPLAGQSIPLRRERVAVLSRDGDRIWVRLDAHLLHYGDKVTGSVIILSDISAHLALSEELSFRSAHDPLTGLMSREQFERELGVLIEEAQTDPEVQHAMAYIDLDQFKVINDTLGHFAGDELLRQLSAEFKGLLRASDHVARLGGDEFGVLMPHCSVAQARPLVGEMLETAREFRFIWEQRSYGMTLSIGLLGITGDTPDVGTALADADATCFIAKEAGRDRVQVAGGGDDVARRRSEMSVLAKINRALDQNLFELHYQDVVCCRAPEKVIYRELLVRMQDEDRPGVLISPAIFIPAAERYSLMGALDRWVINAALSGVARCAEDTVLYAINISGVSINDASFLRYVIEAFQRHAVPPHRICFEITETAAITQLQEARTFIEQLVEVGCCFALDDFGVGMSSFAYLKHLPIRFLKIDGSFVRSMLSNRVDRGMVEAINRIGHEMHLETIGEHVEDLDLLAAIAEIGVDYAQGWGVSRPLPFSTLKTPTP